MGDRAIEEVEVEDDRTTGTKATSEERGGGGEVEDGTLQ
jgi:hypothetical protein